jgi:hypothetical protein
LQGQRSYRFLVRGPDNCKATFWLEYWRDGVLVHTPSFNQRQWVTPQAGLPFDGTVQLTMSDPDPALAGRVRAAWRIEGNAGVTTSSGVIDDPFREMVVRDSTWGTWTGGWQVAPGRTYTMLVLRGARERLLGEPGNSQFARQADVELRLMARFDPLQPGEAKPGPSFGAAADPPADVTSMVPQRPIVERTTATVGAVEIRSETTSTQPAGGSATIMTAPPRPIVPRPTESPAAAPPPSEPPPHAPRATAPSAPPEPHGQVVPHEEHEELESNSPRDLPAPAPHAPAAPDQSHGDGSSHDPGAS